MTEKQKFTRAQTVQQGKGGGVDRKKFFLK